jgi:hypothetical protein
MNNSLGRGQRMTILGGAIGLIAPEVFGLKVLPRQESWGREPDPETEPKRKPRSAHSKPKQLTDTDKAALAKAEEKRTRKAAKRRRDMSVSDSKGPKHDL